MGSRNARRHAGATQSFSSGKIPDEAIRPKPTNQETAGRTGGLRPSGRNAMAGAKMENSRRGAISIQVTWTTAGAAQTTVSTFPCAMATTAQSSSSGIVPPCSHACSGEYASATAMNSQTASDSTAAAMCKRWRRGRLLRFTSCKSFAIYSAPRRTQAVYEIFCRFKPPPVPHQKRRRNRQADVSRWAFRVRR